jgi:cystathionine beta-lyase
MASHMGVPQVGEASPSVRYDATGMTDDLPTYPSRPSYKEFHSALCVDTMCVVFEGASSDPYKPASVPIYQTATFVQPSASEFGSYDYTRSGNPTRTALEKHVAMLEGAHAAFAFGSGMAALAAVTRLLRAGDELLVGEDIYGGMHRLVSKVTSALHGVVVKFVDTTDLRAVEAALTPATRMLHMETPSNPLMRISDVGALKALLAPRGVLLSIDSTMMSPILQRPLSMGADIVIHSATKFFGGHSDVMGGLVCLNDAALTKQIAFFQNAEGNGLDPNSCWLFLRGIKTLALRVERAQASAVQVAAFLRSHHLVKDVFYPGTPSRQGAAAAAEAALHNRQAKGGGSLLSFTTGNTAISRRIIDALRIFKLTVSFGSVSSLCEMPCFLSHASIPAHLRKLPEDLVRLSVGIESPQDLLHDLQQALELAMHPHVINVRSVRRRDTADALGLEALTGGAAAAATPSSGSGSGSSGALAIAVPETPSHREDVAAVAQAQCSRLQASNAELRRKLEEAESVLAIWRQARQSVWGPQGLLAASAAVAGLALAIGLLLANAKR